MKTIKKKKKLMKLKLSFWDQKDIDTWRRSYESSMFLMLLILIINGGRFYITKEYVMFVINIIYSIVPLVVLFSYQRWKNDRKKEK